MQTDYNVAIPILYSEKTLNNFIQRKSIPAYSYLIERSRNITLELKETVNQNYRGELNAMTEVFNLAFELVQLIKTLKNNTIIPEIMTLNNFKSIINNLDIEDGQVLAFKDDFINAI